MTDDLKPANGWNEWAHRVLGDLERLEKKQGEVFTAIDCVKRELAIEIQQMAIEIAVLKTKASFAGGVWGAIVAGVVSLTVALILKHV